MIFTSTQDALAEDKKIIPMCRLTNHLIGIKPKLRGKCRNCYDSVRTINVTLEQSVKLNRRENMYCCYENQLTDIMSIRLETDTNVWSPLGLSGGQREALQHRLGESENTTTLFVNILCQKHTTESMSDLIDKAEEKGNKSGTVTETIDMLTTTEKSGDQFDKNYNMDSGVIMFNRINSLTINPYVHIIGSDREEEVKVISEVAYIIVRHVCLETYDENTNVGERHIDDRLLNKIINYTEHKMKDISTDTLHHNRLSSHVLNYRRVEYGEDLVRRVVVTD